MFKTCLRKSSKTRKNTDKPTIIIIPIDDEDDKNTSLHNSTPRLSTTSDVSCNNSQRRRSRLEVVIRRALIIHPFKKHRCCFGFINLNDAILFISVTEIIFLSFFALTASRIALADGALFYTDLLNGKGYEIIRISYFFVLVSVIVISVTLIGRFIRFKYFYLFHILWQIILIIFLTLSIMLIKNSMQESNSGIPEPNKILKQSAIVILTILGFVLTLQIWCLIIFVEAFIYFKENRKNQQCSEIRIHEDEYSTCEQ